MTEQVELRSIVFEGINQAKLETKPKTFILSPHDVLIKTRYSCISAGTEMAKLTGLQKVSYPFYLGNRAVGHVVATGNDVDNVVIDDLHLANNLCVHFRMNLIHQLLLLWVWP